MSASNLPAFLLGALLVAVVVCWVLWRASRGGRRHPTADLVRRRHALRRQLRQLAGDESAAAAMAQLEARRLGEAASSLAALEAAVARAGRMRGG